MTAPVHDDCMSKYRDRVSSTRFHVYNLGSDGQDIFSLPGDQDIFEIVLGECALRHGIVVEAFALMSNHFHLLIDASDGDLSAFVRDFTAAYASAYNMRTSRRGPLFVGRFSSVPILDDGQFAVVVRYIHRNPLAFIPAASLVAYRWSSLGILAGHRVRPEWFDSSAVLDVVGLESLVDDTLATSEFDRFPVGDLPPDRRTTLGELDEAAGRLEGGGGASGQTLRTVVLGLAVELRVTDIVAIADHFGVKPNSVRTAARRSRIRTGSDPSYARLRQLLLRQLDCADAVPFCPGLNGTG